MAASSGAAEKGSHNRRTSPRLAVTLILAGVAAALLAGEIAARWRWREPLPAAESTPPPPDLSPIAGGVLELASANVEGIYRGVRFRTNSGGFRGREFAAEPPPGTLRIAVAGDSFTMGDGVVEEEAYPHVLEEILHERGCGPVEVLNFGLAGLNVHQVARRARKLGDLYHPHILVYGMTANDIEGPSYRQSSSPLTIADHTLRHAACDGSPSYLLRLVWPRLLSLRELLRPSSGTYTYELLENYFANPDAWQDFTVGLDQVAALADSLTAAPVLFVHPILVYLNRFHPLRPVYRKVSGAAEERGMPVIHSLPRFYGQSPNQLWVAEDDSHPNRLGHRILAEALADGLIALGYLPSCPSPM